MEPAFGAEVYREKRYSPIQVVVFSALMVVVLVVSSALGSFLVPGIVWGLFNPQRIDWLLFGILLYFLLFLWSVVIVVAIHLVEASREAKFSDTLVIYKNGLRIGTQEPLHLSNISEVTILTRKRTVLLRVFNVFVSVLFVLFIIVYLVLGLHASEFYGWLGIKTSTYYIEAKTRDGQTFQKRLSYRTDKNRLLKALDDLGIPHHE